MLFSLLLLLLFNNIAISLLFLLLLLCFHRYYDLLSLKLLPSFKFLFIIVTIIISMATIILIWFFSLSSLWLLPPRHKFPTLTDRISRNMNRHPAWPITQWTLANVDVHHEIIKLKLGKLQLDDNHSGVIATPVADVSQKPVLVSNFFSFRSSVSKKWKIKNEQTISRHSPNGFSRMTLPAIWHCI